MKDRIIGLLDSYLPPNTTQRFFQLANDYKAYTPSAITTLRAYNLLTAILVANNYLYNKDASFSEYGFDLAVHLLQASISEATPMALKGAAISFNLVRLANIVTNLVSGTSTIPALTNLIDIANHSGNIHQTWFMADSPAEDDYDNEEQQDNSAELNAKNNTGKEEETAGVKEANEAQRSERSLRRRG